MNSDVFHKKFPKPVNPKEDPSEIDGWLITEIIGQGGMGKVYKGNKDLEVAAIKTIAPGKLKGEYLTRFRREIKAMKMIQNLYVAEIKGAKLDNEIPYMAIEYIYGNSLDDLITHKKEVTEKSWAIMAMKLFMGLRDIHLRGLIHRDIKPANIMKFKDQDRVKIIDFGIVKGEQFNQITLTSANPGTLLYMSPEQLLHKKLTSKTDIFSLGVTMCMLATFRHPFEPKKPSENVLSKISYEDPDLSQLTENQKIICQMALIKDPEKRSDASDIVSTIHKLYKLPAFPIRKIVNSKVAVKPEIKKKNSTVKASNLSGVLEEIQVKQNLPKTNKVKVSPDALENFINFLTHYILGVKNTFNLSVDTSKFAFSPYIQGITEADGMITLEAVSNNFLEPKLNSQELAQMKKLGWEDPEDQLPNFTIFCKQDKPNILKISKVISSTLFDIFEANQSSTFNLRPITENQALEINKKFNIKFDDDGSFKLPELNKAKTSKKNNTYIDWKLIGIFNSRPKYEFIELLTVNRKTHRVYRRRAKEWVFDRIDSNILSDFPLALPFSTKAISLVDDYFEKKKTLTYNHFGEDYINLAPTPTDEFLKDFRIERFAPNPDALDTLQVLYYNIEARGKAEVAALTKEDEGYYWLRRNKEWHLISDDMYQFFQSCDSVKPSFIEFYDKYNQSGIKELPKELIRPYLK